MCEHLTFEADVQINRFEDTQDGANLRCAVDLRVHCVECREFLRFALPFGVNLVHGATMSIDGKEARLVADIGIPRATALSGFNVELS